MVGWRETPFWARRATEEARKLAPPWLEYRGEAYGEELARGGMPPFRVLPTSETLRESSEVLPYDALEEKIDEQTFCAVKRGRG